MIKDPCETCLVQACCEIREKTVHVKCGCDVYEVYKTWKYLFNYCSHNEYLTQLMMEHNPRIKKLSFKNKYL